MLKAMIALFLVSAPAHAAKFTCTGSVLLYGFTLTGATDDTHVVGDVHLAVTQAGALFRQGSNPAQQSAYLPGKQLYLDSTQAGNGRIVLNTGFRGKNVYDGPMNVFSPQGNVTVPVTCSVQ